MKFADVKNLPAPLQPLALECVKMEENYVEVKAITLKLIEEVTFTKSLVQALLNKLSEPEVHDEHNSADEKLGADNSGAGAEGTGSGGDAAAAPDGAGGVAVEHNA